MCSQYKMLFEGKYDGITTLMCTKAQREIRVRARKTRTGPTELTQQSNPLSIKLAALLQVLAHRILTI
jgi:hypothetical protein